MTNGNAKGKRGEQEASRLVSKLFGVDAKRTQQHSGAGKVGDIDGLPGVHLEVKRRKSLHLYTAMEQAVGDAPCDTVPMVLYREDCQPGEAKKPWLAIVRLEDLPALAVLLRDILLESDQSSFRLTSPQKKTAKKAVKKSAKKMIRCPYCGGLTDGHSSHRSERPGPHKCMMVKDRRGGWRQLGVYDG